MATLSQRQDATMWNFPLFPDQASTMARQVDALYFFELGDRRLLHGPDLRADS